MLVGVVAGAVQRYPTKCHSENDEEPLPVIEAIRRRFNLTKEHGVSDDDFYNA